MSFPESYKLQIYIPSSSGDGIIETHETFSVPANNALPSRIYEYQGKEYTVISGPSSCFWGDNPKWPQDFDVSDHLRVINTNDWQFVDYKRYSLDFNPYQT